MCNIIIESDAFKGLVENLKENYKDQTIMLVTTKTEYIKNKNVLQCLINEVENIKTYFVDDYVKSNEIFIQMLEKELKHCNVIICFGCGQLVDLIKIVATRLCLKYFIVPSGLKSGNYLVNYSVVLDKENCATHILTKMPECLYVDVDILSKANSKEVGELFAFVLSHNLIVCKMLYAGVKEKVIEGFVALLRAVNVFTSENVKLTEGKVKLFKLMLEIQLWLNNCGIESNMDIIICLFNKFYKSKDLETGEISLIFSLLILTLHEKIIENEICMPSLNIGKRIERIKMLFVKQENVESALNNFDNNMCEINECISQKEVFLKNIKSSLFRIQNNLSMLKRIYVNKGVAYGNVNIEEYYQTLSVACDIIGDKYLNVLSVVGVL